MSALDRMGFEPRTPAVPRHAAWATAAAAATLAALAVAPTGWALAGAAAAALAVSAWLGGAAPWRAGGVRGLAALAAFVVLANAVFLPGEPLRVGGLALPASREGLALGVWTALRAVTLVLVFRAWMSGVRAADLSALVARVTPASSRGRAAAGLVAGIARRSIPGFAREARRLSLQRALRRGWPGPGLPHRERERRLATRWRDLPAVVVPLVLLGIRRAELVSLALAARYAGAAVPTPPALTPVGAGERLTLTGALLLLAVVLAARLWSA